MSEKDIDWDSAPEGYPVWIVSKNGTAEWHRDDGDCWIDIHGGFFYKEDESIKAFLPLATEKPWSPFREGTNCVVIPHNTQWGFDSIEPVEAKIAGYYDDYIWLLVSGKKYITSRTDKIDLLPFKTLAEMDADEARLGIAEMLSGAAPGENSLELCKRLYREGWRKVGGE